MPGLFKPIVLSFTLLSCCTLFAQEQQPAASTTKTAQQNGKGIIVTGVLKDAASGKPLSAINVSVPNYSAASTDAQGRFSIKVPDYHTTLFVTAEGYQAKEIPLKGRNSVTAVLFEAGFTSIYDNVTLPTGLRSQNQTVNAVASVNTDGNWNRPLETPESYLQGKVAGLQPIMRSGTPGVGAYLTLRGYNSLYATNQPLVVVDGQIFDINDYGPSIIANHFTDALSAIDIKDIENITVIKDAVSTYGTKAANGVILITTSHAKQLATKIDAAVYAGINFRPERLPVMRSGDYRTYLSEILKSRGWSNDQIQAQPYMNDNPNNPEYYRYHNETDWQDQVMKNSSTSNFFMKVTGGDNIAKYALSIGYTKDAGITKGTDLTKYNVRFNGDLNLSRRLTATSNLAYTYYEQNLRDQGQAYKTNPLFLALVKAPFLNTNEVSDKGAISPNLAETDTLGVGNPASAVSSVIGNSKVYRFFGSLNFKYELSRAINIYSLVGVTVNQVREQTFIPRKGLANDTLENAIADSRMAGQPKRFNSLFNDTYISYSKTFNRVHKLDARAGLRYVMSTNEQDPTFGYNSATDQFVSVGTGVSTLRRTGGDYGKYNWLNNYLSADYSYANKYFLSYNMAVDASSRFGSNIDGALKIGSTNLAVLPSLGASWLISSEDFMANARFIDLLKLRASYGLVGNDDIGNYSAKELYTSQNLLGLQGLVRSSIGNPALQWESNTKANFGIDAAFLNERLNLSIDVFQNKTNKMLAQEPFNIASGYEYALTNSGSMKTTGLDVSLNARIINTKAVKWDAGVVAGTYKNEITKLPAGATYTTFGGATVRTQVGAPANQFFGYKTSGVFATDQEAAASGLTTRSTTGDFVAFKGGDVRFVDVNNDKVIDENDRQVIGDPNPTLAGGFTNRVTYKGFALEALMTFSSGNDLYNGTRAALESGSNIYNQLESVNNRWRAPGQVTNIPKASYGDPMGNSRFSDRWIEDGSFLRMKELSLSYTYNFKAASTIKSSTLYVTANNLFTLTHYLGYDPEFQAAETILARGIDVGLEPNYRSIIAGVRIGL